jgi:hypothetical protein
MYSPLAHPQKSELYRHADMWQMTCQLGVYRPPSCRACVWSQVCIAIRTDSTDDMVTIIPLEVMKNKRDEPTVFLPTSNEVAGLVKRCSKVSGQVVMVRHLWVIATKLTHAVLTLMCFIIPSS